MLNVNREQFRHSAQTKKVAAQTLLDGNSKHPYPAVYLSHVIIECALKRRILIINNATHLNELKKKMQAEDFNALFMGATGHDLHHLHRTASLRRYLEAKGQASLLDEPEWAKMGGQRPYSLRYGVEKLAARDAEKQVEFARKLVELLLQEVQ
jgi:hypothetical protein